ncbi:MAG: hypothetical protein Q9159_004664 [Coniocarpon cinnabarinum]
MTLHHKSHLRLKPVKQDPLECIGLPSKGESGLTHPKAQEQYFQLLLSRSMNLGIHPPHVETTGGENASLDTVVSNLQRFAIRGGEDTAQLDEKSQQELTILLSAMRKLRESLVATKRFDSFTNSAYLFIIRSTISVEHHEAYYPALLHALRVLDHDCRFTESQREELAAYAVLDVAGRQNALREAWETAWRHKLFTSEDRSPSHQSSQQAASKPPPQEARGHHIRAVLRAAIHVDVLAFHRCKVYLSRNEQILLRPLEERLTSTAVVCLQRGYFAAELGYVEKVLDLSWSNREEREARHIAHVTRSWRIENAKLVFRHPTRK